MSEEYVLLTIRKTGVGNGQASEHENLPDEKCFADAMSVANMRVRADPNIVAGQVLCVCARRAVDILGIRKTEAEEKEARRLKWISLCNEFGTNPPTTKEK